MAGPNLLSILERRTEVNANRMAFTFARHSDLMDDCDTVSYSELDLLAHRTSAWLEERTEPGDRVLLLHSDSGATVVLTDRRSRPLCGDSGSLLADCGPRASTRAPSQ